MSKQVAGKPEGATLLDAINDGDVEFPGRMTFMDWLKWRKSTGTRPLKKRDGVSTTLEEENVLWKEVMDFLHDAGEEELEEEEEEEEEEEQEADTAVEPAPPAPHPAAGAHTGLTDEELAGLDATSVELLPDAEREAALAFQLQRALQLQSLPQGRVLLWRDRLVRRARQAPSRPRPRRFKRNSANSTGLTKSLLVTT